MRAPQKDDSIGKSRRLWVFLAGFGVLLLLASASPLVWEHYLKPTPTAFIVPPGREALVLSVFEEPCGSERCGENFSVRINHGWLELVPFVGTDAPWRMKVAPGPGFSCPGAFFEVRPGVFLDHPEDELSGIGALVREIASNRDRIGESIWTRIPVVQGERIDGLVPESEQWSGSELVQSLIVFCLNAPITGQSLTSYLLVLFLLGWGLWTIVTRSRNRGTRPASPEERGWFPATMILILAFLLAAGLFPDKVSIHDHNSFVGRSDCAWRWSCDSSPYSEAWLPPTYHVYGLLLHLVPQTVLARSALSIALSAAMLLLLQALVSSLFLLYGDRASARSAGFWAMAVLAANPLFLRLAAADSFWPFSLACLLAAGLVLVKSPDSRAPLVDLVAAAALLYFAVMGNYVSAVWASLLVIAPLAWSSRLFPGVPWRRRLLAIGVFGLVFAALAVPGLLTMFLKTFAGPTSVAATDGMLKGTMVDIWLNQVFLSRSTASPLAIVFFPVGLVVLSLRPRLALPVLWAYAVSHTFLGRDQLLADMEPTNLLHFFPSIIFSGFLIGAGMGRISALIPGRRYQVAIQALFGLALLGSIPLQTRGLELFKTRQVLEQELLDLSLRFPELPEHDLLVIPPHSQKNIGGISAADAGDPVEAYFPEVEYEQAMDDLGRQVPRPMALSDFLEMGPSGRNLFYLSSTYFTFLQVELPAMPASMERPLLERVRHDCSLEPVLTWRMGTWNHPARFMRVTGDRLEEVEVGFYWISCPGKP